MAQHHSPHLCGASPGGLPGLPGVAIGVLHGRDTGLCPPREYRPWPPAWSSGSCHGRDAATVGV